MTKRRFALAFLAAAVVALGLAGRVPATPPPRGLDVSVVTAMAGRLQVSPVGTIARAEDLRAPDSALGRITLTNVTRRAVALRLRALPSTPELDDAVRVSVQVGGIPVRRTTLGRLRADTAPIRLEPGLRTQVSVRLWLTPGADYAGRTVDVVLELPTRAPYSRRSWTLR